MKKNRWYGFPSPQIVQVHPYQLWIIWCFGIHRVSHFWFCVPRIRKWIFARLSSLIDSKCVSGSIKDHFKSKPLYTLRILVLKVSIEPSKNSISWMAKWYLAYFYPFLEITHKLRKHWCLRAIKRFILHMVCFKTIKFIPCLRTFAAFNTYFETKSYVLFHCISETHNSYSQVLVFL